MGEAYFTTVTVSTEKEGVQKVFGTLDLFVSLLETEIKYPILQGGILPFWTPSFVLGGFMGAFTGIKLNRELNRN